MAIGTPAIRIALRSKMARHGTKSGTASSPIQTVKSESERSCTAAAAASPIQRGAMRSPPRQRTAPKTTTTTHNVTPGSLKSSVVAWSA